VSYDNDLSAKKTEFSQIKIIGLLFSSFFSSHTSKIIKFIFEPELEFQKDNIPLE
jgi:hypothetical protein